MPGFHPPLGIQVIKIRTLFKYSKSSASNAIFWVDWTCYATSSVNPESSFKMKTMYHSRSSARRRRRRHFDKLSNLIIYLHSMHANQNLIPFFFKVFGGGIDVHQSTTYDYDSQLASSQSIRFYYNQMLLLLQIY